MSVWDPVFSAEFGDPAVTQVPAPTPTPTVTHATVQAEIDAIVTALAKVRADIGKLTP